MPEFPEVETIRRNIERFLVGDSVSNLEVSLPKLLRESPIPQPDVLVGRRLTRTRRRAKVLVIDFDADLSLMIHLKLAGQWAIVLPDGSRSVAGHPIPDPTGEYPQKSTHATFTFESGARAYYSDVRQFGWFRILPSDDVEATLDAFGFGPEGYGGSPLEQEVLAPLLARRRIPIKTLLLDQTFISGLGNIYVDEALHRARIHPARPANSLSDEEVSRLLEAVPWALGEGLKQGGAKIVHSRAFPIDDFPAVHAREGEFCIHCGSVIQKSRVGGRGTYFCPQCQPEP